MLKKKCKPQQVHLRVNAAISCHNPVLSSSSLSSEVLIISNNFWNRVPVKKACPTLGAIGTLVNCGLKEAWIRNPA